MARRPRRLRKFSLPKHFRIGNLIIAGMLVVLVLGLFNGLRSFVAASPYFRIEKVDIALIGGVPLTEKTVRELLSVHKGRNIFDVNLASTKDFLLLHYPEMRSLVINRVFPNKLVLKVRPRRPAVQASLASGFCLIDQEAVVLPGIIGLAREGLPIISGMEPRAVVSSTGRRYENPGLKNALSLLRAVKETGFSDGHDIHMIDVSDEKNLSMYIEGGLEIKIGGEDFKKRLSLLKKTFDTTRLDKTQIRYIDLRFDNIVIGPR